MTDPVDSRMVLPDHGLPWPPPRHCAQSVQLLTYQRIMVARNSKDLFDESTMSFGDHLEVLRVHLFKALIGLVVGSLILAVLMLVLRHVKKHG